MWIKEIDVSSLECCLSEFFSSFAYTSLKNAVSHMELFICRHRDSQVCWHSDSWIRAQVWCPGERCLPHWILGFSIEVAMWKKNGPWFLFSWTWSMWFIWVLLQLVWVERSRKAIFGRISSVGKRNCWSSRNEGELPAFRNPQRSHNSLPLCWFWRKRLVMFAEKDRYNDSRWVFWEASWAQAKIWWRNSPLIIGDIKYKI